MKKNWSDNRKSIVDGPQSIVGSRWLAKWAWIAMMVLLLGVSCNRSGQYTEQDDRYTCPMHPTVVSDKSGTCPVCGMDLVRKVRPGEAVTITEDLSRQIRSTNEVVMGSVRTIKGEFKSMAVHVEGQGIVTYDTRNVYMIPARIGGRLEKVLLKYTFQPVKRGQKIAEIYSPELLTAQRELLFLIGSDPANVSLIEAAKDKLYFLGSTQDQIADIMKRKEVDFTFSIYSPYDGYVIKEDQQVPAINTSRSSSASQAMSGGMAGGKTSSGSNITPSSVSTSELIREGSYVSAGQSLFKVVGKFAMRVELDFPAAQSGRVSLNDEVELDLGNGKMVKAKVDFVQPFFTEGEAFVKVRLYIKNSNELQIGQLVRASIRLKTVEALWVPREAVLDLGLEKIVFVKQREVFKPKSVEAGHRTDDGWVEITQGLSTSDEIASNAQYLVDSESFIKVKR